MWSVLSSRTIQFYSSLVALCVDLMKTVCVCVCLTVYSLYYRKAPSRMLFHFFFYFLTA